MTDRGLRGFSALFLLTCCLGYAQTPNHQDGSVPAASASAHSKAIGQDEPLLWLRVLASLAKGTPSQELIAEIKGRSIAFLLFNPSDEINQEYVRSLGGTEGLIRAAREARNGDDDLTEAPKLQFAAAETDVRKALTTKPNKAVLHQLLGMILLLQQPKDGAAELREAIALDPKSASSHLYLGWALLGADAKDEASTEFRESLRLMPHQTTSHLLLYSLLKQKDKDGALAELKQALQVDPGAVPVHEDLGDYYSEQKEYDLAIPEYQTAVRLDAGSFRPHMGLALALYAKADYAKAVPEFQEYLRLDKRPGSENARSYLAICFYNLGQFEQAATEERTILTAHPDDQNAKGWLAAATSKMSSSAGIGRVNGGETQTEPSGTAVRHVTATAPLVQKVQPVYPPEARNARVQGLVSLHAIIGVDGSVKELTVISGPPQLTEAALDAVRQWRYQPYLLDGRPVEVDTQVDVNFVLEVAKAGAGQATESAVGSSAPANSFSGSHSAATSNSGTAPSGQNGPTPPREQDDCVQITRTRTDNNYCNGRPAFVVEFRNACSTQILFKLCTQHTGGWKCASGMLNAGEESSNGMMECGQYNEHYKYWGFISEPGVNMFNYLPPDPL
jgi:TonB family protein